jgi:hypothetical protein
MTTWRPIMTDSESLSGVAPACPHQDDPAKHPTGFERDPAAADWVFDCCPHPHIECYDERRAAEIARALTEAEAEVCS